MKKPFAVLLLALIIMLLFAGCTQQEKGIKENQETENQETLAGSQGTENEEIENQETENQENEETIYQGYTEEEALQDLEAQLNGLEDEDIEELVQEIDNYGTQGS